MSDSNFPLRRSSSMGTQKPRGASQKSRGTSQKSSGASQKFLDKENIPNRARIGRTSSEPINQIFYSGKILESNGKLRTDISKPKSAKSKAKQPFKSLFSRISKMTKTQLEKLSKPIGYAYDPKATLGVKSQGLVSYELIEQDPDQDINGKKLSDKLPAGKSIRIPKGFKITKICGGGSGSVNMLIYNKETDQRFFMKYFHSTDAKLKGHNWKQQFNETVAIFNQQVGRIPLLENRELSNIVDKGEAKKLSDDYRMSVYQLGVVVQYSKTRSESGMSNESEYDSDSSVQSLASGSSGELNLQTSISRMEGSMDNSPLVEATFTLSEVAEGAEDLCDVITKSDADINQLVNVSKEYLEDMTKFQLGIASRPLPEVQSQKNDNTQFVTKMTDRFAQLDGSLSNLNQMSLEAALPQSDEPTGLETIGSMVSSESFKFAGQSYPNPSQFLPNLFKEFPTLFCSKMEVFDVHGDGQASNLMFDSKKNKLVQVDVRKGDELVTPHAEAAKMVVFGPEFTGCILNGQASVNFDATGLTLTGDKASNLANHQEYKRQLLEALDDTSWGEMQAFQQAVSPDFGLNIRLLGAVQAEADIGSFLAKFKQSPNDINLKRRAVADKVLALKLQKELFDYINDEKNFLKSPELQSERARLKDYIDSEMGRLNP